MIKKLFENPGRKIKALALTIFLLILIITIIIGLIILLRTGYYLIHENYKEFADRLRLGLLLIVLGPIVSYISALFVYGFGQLIENTEVLFHIYRKIPLNKKSESSLSSEEN